MKEEKEMITTKRLNLFEEFKLDFNNIKKYYYNLNFFKRIEETEESYLINLFENNGDLYYDYKNDNIVDISHIHNNYDEYEENLIIINLFLPYYYFGDSKNNTLHLVAYGVNIHKKYKLLYQINLDLPDDYLDDITKKFYACGFNVHDITPDSIDYIIQLLD